MVLASVISGKSCIHEHSSGEAEHVPLICRSIGAGGADRLLVGLQLPASSCSRSRMLVVSGRADGESVASYSSSHVRANNAHNASENPTVGRSGRFPLTTFEMTAASGLVCSKGLRPVITCRSNLCYCNRNNRGNGVVRASRIVIPRAYISVLFDGNFLRARLTYPYFSGSNISGAIHRVVPPALWLLGPSIELTSSMIAASPKSAKQARHSELMRMFACVLHQLHDLTSSYGGDGCSLL